MIRVELSAKASRDVHGQLRYYAMIDTALANRFRAAVFSSFRSIQSFPLAYQRYADGTHRFVMRQFPFLIVYRIDVEIVKIVRVIHQARSSGWRV